MKRLMSGLVLALLLAGCQGDGDKAATEGAPSESAVQAGATKDSADPRLNALQRTKRNVNKIEADRKKQEDAGSWDD